MPMKTTAAKFLTLLEYAEQMGSQEKAARTFPVSFKCYNNWVNGHTQPVLDSIRKRFAELGVLPPRVTPGAWRAEVQRKWPELLKVAA